MRVLIDRRPSGPDADGDQASPAELYAEERSPWLRANMVATVDGAATGADGLTGTINNPIDKKVFHLLRRMSDAIIVGAGTARAERYGPAVRPLVIVTRLGTVPTKLAGATPGSVLVATCQSAEGVASTRQALGDENVLVLGDDSVDLSLLVRRLNERGLVNLLCEGGPSLLADLAALSLVDELCLTQTPALVGGDQSRITSGLPVDVPLELHALIEAQGTLLARWSKPTSNKENSWITRS